MPHGKPSSHRQRYRRPGRSRYMVWVAMVLVIPSNALRLQSTTQTIPSRTDIINILLILPFAINDSVSDPVQNSFTLNSVIKGWQIAAEAAVGEITAVKTFLPGIQINLIPVNIWNPAMPKPPQMNLITSGGYSAVTLYDVLTTMNISGIAGDFYSKTTVFSAGVSSQLKVPFCGASQASTSLADKRRFPYFYRTFRAKGVANHITRLFLQWKVQRMAILHSTDDLSVTQAVDAVAAMTQAEIEVSMVGRMTPDMHKRKDYGRIFEVLKSHGCKYIYISALDVQVRDVYHAAIDAGLVGPNFIWLSYNVPLFTAGKNNTAVEGFVYLTTQSGYTNTFMYKRFLRNFWGRASGRLQKEHFSGLHPLYANKAYDCVKSMLIGFDKLYQERQWWTNASFTDPGNRDLMRFDAFSKTGYVDSINNIFELDDGGDVIQPIAFVTLNETMLKQFQSLNAKDAFAMTTPDAMQLIELRDPVFYGGSNTPPPSKTLMFEQTLPSTSVPIIILQILQVSNTLLVLCALSGLFLRFRSPQPPKKGHLDVISWACALSAILSNGASFWFQYIPVIKVLSSCSVRGFVYALSISLAVSSAGATVVHKYIHSMNAFSRERVVGSGSYIPWMLGLCVLNLLIYLMSYLLGRVRLGRVVVGENEFIETCTAENNGSYEATRVLFFSITAIMLMAFLLLASKAGASGTAELQWYFRISFFGLLSIVAMETLFSPSAFRVAIEFSIIAILSISGATMSLIFQNKKGSKKVLQSGSSALTMRGSMREYSYFLGKWKIWHKTTFGWHFAHIFQVIFVQRNDRMYITLLPTPSKQNPELKKEDVILHEVEGLWGSNLFTETSKGLSLFNHQPIIESDQTPTSTDDIPIDSGLNRCVLLDLPNWTVLMKAEKKYYKNEAVEILKRHAEGIARIMSMNEIEGSSGLYASGNMR